MPLSKGSMAGKKAVKGGVAKAAPPPTTAKVPIKEKPMAGKKLRILVPAAFEAAGVATWEKDKDGKDVRQLDEATVDADLAKQLIAAGQAEELGAKE